MKDLLVRTVSGVVLAVTAVLGVLYLPVWMFKLLVAVLSGVGSWEVFSLLSKRFNGIKPILSGMTGFFLSAVLLFFNLYLAIFLIFLFSFYISHRVYRIDTLAAYIFGFSYAVFFISSIAILHEYNRFLVLVLFATVWAGDTMAYFVGKMVGKHKFAPRLSPKKTWEGALGGIAGSVVLGGVVAYYLEVKDAFIPVVLSAFLIQIGDLFESFIKRQVGQKDSSNLIPGHGGVLDRIDALIFGAVVFVIYYQLSNTL
ncbi:phosphatidate cytidylyltransferase [Persephonella hydrogeniphila]|uniref:Phosphatidate cytidylyltransferase n=1 Tax=Persephonella hydrogeniphila TaxID=198703 RepID=A0A285NCB5_9AQUI|nr:phosphatidate cytidylyltransferase [Persephonella hydrogeniphila]SNZ07090.1 phosphatidate cytidylyltransferase [Persephonella hydrogeniphila]